jgi:hypothetical protein
MLVVFEKGVRRCPVNALPRTLRVCKWAEGVRGGGGRCVEASSLQSYGVEWFRGSCCLFRDYVAQGP